MGRAKAWCSEEHAGVAQAWINVSEDKNSLDIKGTNQDSDTFWKAVIANLATLAPSCATETEARWHFRGRKSIERHWKDNIARECKKFNKSVLKVHSSNPTGVGDDEKMNMAAAIHLGKTDVMTYRFKDFPIADWKFHGAWKILKDHPMFAPPKPKEAVEIPDDLDEENEDSSVSMSIASQKVSAMTTATVATPSAGSKRGPGSGKTKSKIIAAENEYKNKKIKALSDMVIVQQKRHAEFALHVSNTARAEAFKCAALGYATFKDDDPVMAQRYKDTMGKIMARDTDADKNLDSMPPLAGFGEGTSAGTDV